MENKDDDSVEESLNAIEDEQVTEQPNEQSGGLSIADESEQKADPNHPLRHKLAQFIKSGWGKTLVVFVLIVGVTLAVPMTRYALLGVFIKKQTVITVVDDATGKPVSDATVHFARVDGVTDKQGVVTLNDMAVGDHPLSVEKKYYDTTSTSYTVPIFGDAAATVKLKATGRLAVVTVKNAISGKVVTGASVKIGDTSAVTDDTGVANIALAIRDADQPGTVSLDGYNQAEISVSTKDVSPTLDVALVPSGSVYFISNRSGSYNIMSSDLDGANQKVVLKGTGLEVPYELQLQTSPSGDTVVFTANREGKLALYALNTATKALAKIGDSDMSYGFIGWAGDTLYYMVYANQGAYTPGRTKVMSYNQSTKKVTQIDSSQIATNNSIQIERNFSEAQLTGGRLYYARCWQATSYSAATFAQKAGIMTVVDGKAVTLKEVDQTKSAYCSTFVKKPNTLYFKVANTYNGADTQYFRYQVGGSVESASLSEADFVPTVTYYASPNGTKTFWSEMRDGKPVSYVGDANGGNARQTGGGDAFHAYGWLSDSYILFSKNNNELYVMSADGQGEMHKVVDYYSGAPQAY